MNILYVSAHMLWQYFYVCVYGLPLHVLRRFSRVEIWLPKVDWLGSWHLTSLFSQLNHDNHSWHLVSFIFCFDTYWVDESS